MKVLVGSPGTTSGLVLRISQCTFAAASIVVMISAKGFSNYTAFCYLIASMGLQVLWSIGLACLDMYALRIKRDLHNPVLVSLFVVGDWVTATLSLAAACSSAGVAVLFARDVNFCKTLSYLSCDRFGLFVWMMIDNRHRANTMKMNLFHLWFKLLPFVFMDKFLLYASLRA